MLFPQRPRRGAVPSFNGRDWEPSSALAGGLSLNSFNDVTDLTNVPTWLKVGTRTYENFSAAALTSSLTLFALAPMGLIQAVKIKHSTAFAGGAIASYTVSVGIVGTVAKYAAAFDVFQAVSGTAFQLSATAGSESHTAAVAITITATSTVANLDAATAGAVDVWALLSMAGP